MNYDPNVKWPEYCRLSLRNLGLLLVLAAFGFVYGLCLLFQGWQEPRASARAELREPMRQALSVEVGGACERWQAESLSAKGQAELTHVTGLVSSQQYRNILYHLTDASREPTLVVTDLTGHVLQEVHYAAEASEPEALSTGPCPWGGFCLFVADTGDAFHIRYKKRIHAIDERSIFSNALHSAELEFQYPQNDRWDVEALAVHPKTGDMFLFSKESGRSLVFRLAAKAWLQNDGERVAEQVGYFPYDKITDAAWSADGKRLLVINAQGFFERTGQGDAEHSERDGWLPFERKLRLPVMENQNAVTYLADQKSFVYSSPKKLFGDQAWGLMRAQCLSR